MPRHSLYVISDLHLGGDPAERGIPGERGFQICRQGKLAARFVRALADRRPGSLELVINGDIVDFLAEHPLGGGWRPFHRDAFEASRILCIIVREREPDLFSALREFVTAKHRLTLILGNHDLELSLPAVRQKLREVLGASHGQLQFLYDNEAYVVGRAVIEHGKVAPHAAGKLYLPACSAAGGAEENSMSATAERAGALPAITAAAASSITAQTGASRLRPDESTKPLRLLCWTRFDRQASKRPWRRGKLDPG